jgi:mitotic-spindle organizing protein 1
LILVIYEISLLLNTEISREALEICVDLIDSGVNPEALAMVVNELKRESLSLCSGKK